MSSVEERLVRDIEAVTGGVVVTQADLEQARDKVEDRIERSGRGRRRWTALAAAATAAAVVGAVTLALTTEPAGEADPAGSGPENDPWASFLKGDAPTEEAVRGVWRVDNGSTLVRFTGDEVALDTRGQITAPEIEGSYVLEGDQIVMDLEASAGPGCSGEAAFRASVVGPGEMRMVADDAVTDGCVLEQSGRWVLEHVLPTSREMVDFGLPKSGGYGPLERAVVPGFWLVVGGGTGLQLSPEGTYAALDDSGEVVEQGRWQLDGEELSLTADTTGCRVVLSNAQHVNPGTDMIRGELTEYRCEMPWVSGDGGDTMEWFQIPDRSSF